jgi:hypothetical protein
VKVLMVVRHEWHDPALPGRVADGEELLIMKESDIMGIITGTAASDKHVQRCGSWGLTGCQPGLCPNRLPPRRGAYAPRRGRPYPPRHAALTRASKPRARRAASAWRSVSAARAASPASRRA